jgi:hypothetical protein
MACILLKLLSATHNAHNVDSITIKQFRLKAIKQIDVFSINEYLYEFVQSAFIVEEIDLQLAAKSSDDLHERISD